VAPSDAERLREITTDEIQTVINRFAALELVLSQSLVLLKN